MGSKEDFPPETVKEMKHLSTVLSRVLIISFICSKGLFFFILSSFSLERIVVEVVEGALKEETVPKVLLPLVTIFFGD